jgi:hypothetical protein
VSEQPPPQFTNYPRPQFSASSEFLREPGIHFEAIGDSWKIINADLGTWALISLGGLLLVLVIQLPTSLIAQYIEYGGHILPVPGENPSLSNVLLATPISFIGGVLSFPVMGGLYSVALRRIRGEQPDISYIFDGFKKFVPFLGFGILYYLAIIVGSILCIVPGLYLFGALSLAPLLIIDKGMGPVEAMSTSMRTLGSNAWMMLVFLFVASFFAGLGIVACCVGILITWPIIFIGTALHYHYYFDQQADAAFSQTEFIPPTGPIGS